MSKTMKYVQCLYYGEEDRELEVPDDATVFLSATEDGENGFRFHVLVRTSEEVDSGACFLIGKYWFTFLYRIRLQNCDLPCKLFTECEPPKDCYIVFQQKNLFDWSTCYDILESCKDENGEIDWEKAGEYRMETTGISKIRRFTDRGIETVYLSIKDMTMHDHVSAELHTWSYDYTWGCIHPCDFGNFFTTEEKYKQLFNDKLEDYYKLFKE